MRQPMERRTVHLFPGRLAWVTIVPIRAWLLIAGAGATVAFASAAEGTPSPPPEPLPLANATLAPALSAAAERDGIALYGVEVRRSEPALGDAVVAWIGVRNGKTTQQWLVQLRRDAATAAEQESWRGRVKAM